MSTWVLVLILSGNNAGALVPAGITTIPGYASIVACRNAGAMMKIADAETRLEERQTTIVIIESRCISGPEK